jgi:hypothetical protein
VGRGTRTEGDTGKKGYVTNKETLHWISLHYTSFLVNGTPIIQMSPFSVEGWP